MRQSLMHPDASDDICSCVAICRKLFAISVRYTRGDALWLCGIDN